MKIAVVGSGLAAVAALRVLVQRGHKPVVFDVGETAPGYTKEVVARMAQQRPGDWDENDLCSIAANPTISRKHAFPRKLAFGSDFFYGRASDSFRMSAENGQLPPFSHARGGFSEGWGAAVLPPDESDLKDWPIGNEELSRYYRMVLADLPFSAARDELAHVFPLFSDPDPVAITPGCLSMLEDMRACSKRTGKDVVFGQARVLTAATDAEKRPACRYCGHCMSGCVYGSIYKASQGIEALIAAGAIHYRSGCLVREWEETDTGVKLKYLENNSSESQLFDRVFLAAGATGSTRIALRSIRRFDEDVRLRSTDGFVVPLLCRKKAALEWPRVNTQPGIFLEFKLDGFSDHWVHTQLSTPNELVLQRLGIRTGPVSVGQRLKWWIAERLIIAHCNLHSELSNHYSLRLCRRGADEDELISRRGVSDEFAVACKKASRKLASVAWQAGCYSVNIAAKNTATTGSYHVGGTMPMRLVPGAETETNLLGNPKNHTRVHVIDSSVFPSLPGTTLGLLAMANAARIATEADLA